MTLERTAINRLSRRINWRRSSFAPTRASISHSSAPSLTFAAHKNANTTLAQKRSNNSRTHSPRNRAYTKMLQVLQKLRRLTRWIRSSLLTSMQTTRIRDGCSVWNRRLAWSRTTMATGLSSCTTTRRSPAGGSAEKNKSSMKSTNWSNYKRDRIRRSLTISTRLSVSDEQVIARSITIKKFSLGMQSPLNNFTSQSARQL